MFVKWSICWIKKIYNVIETSIGFLRQKGILSAYTDNIVLIHKFFDAYVSTTVATIKLLDKLGFVIHLIISVLVSTQCTTKLGFS